MSVYTTRPHIRARVAYIFNRVRGPVLPDEVEEAVVRVLEHDGALGGIGVNEVGVTTAKCPASFESETNFCHLGFNG